MSFTAIDVKNAHLLGDTKDWYLWIEQKKVTALERDIWKFINPSIERSALPKLTRPERPTPSLVHPPIQGSSIPTAYSHLTIDEKEEYKSLREDYAIDEKEYKQKEHALAAMRTVIFNTVKKDFLTYLIGCDTAYDMLVKLKTRFCPNDKIRERSLIEQYNEACKFTPNQEIESWLQKWETTVDYCKEMNIPHVTGAKPLFDFVKAVGDIYPGFSDIWTIKLLEDDNRELGNLTQQFRDYQRS
jgi:hypothetical protein